MGYEEDCTETAYHEAGHAVVAWFCDHAIGPATIKPDAERGWAGFIRHKDAGCNELFGRRERLHPHADAPGGWVLVVGGGQGRDLTDIEQRVLKIQDDMMEIDVCEKGLMVAAAGVVAQDRAIPGSVEPYHDEEDWESATEDLQSVCEMR